MTANVFRAVFHDRARSMAYQMV